jgi:hypothetical protein
MSSRLSCRSTLTSPWCGLWSRHLPSTLAVDKNKRVACAVASGSGQRRSSSASSYWPLYVCLFHQQLHNFKGKKAWKLSVVKCLCLCGVPHFVSTHWALCELVYHRSSRSRLWGVGPVSVASVCPGILCSVIVTSRRNVILRYEGVRI